VPSEQPVTGTVATAALMVSVPTVHPVAVPVIAMSVASKPYTVSLNVMLYDRLVTFVGVAGGVLLDTVMMVPFTLMALRDANDAAFANAGKVSVALFPAASAMTPLFNANAVVD
jgi:hypothetical protein